MPTVRDIAKLAHVSAATVSRALNNHPAVNDATRYAVLKAAETLNYPIDQLRSNKPVSESVLILMREDESSTTGGMRDFERLVWMEVHRLFELRGITTRLQQSRMTRDEARQIADDPSVSGLILLGGIINHDFTDQLDQRGIPYVIAGARFTNAEKNVVMADVPQGIRQAAEHLIQSGRRRLGLVNGPETTSTSYEKRDTLALVMSLHGLRLEPHHIATSDFTAEDGYRQTAALLAAYPEVDAILYADDHIAMGGLRAVREAGKAVPTDIALVGFGDFDLARYTEPPLSSVMFDRSLIGRIAAKRLAMLLDDADDDAWLVRVPCTFTPRAST